MTAAEHSARFNAALAAEAEAAEKHRAGLRTACDYCNKLCGSVVTPTAYEYATQARGVAEAYMNAAISAASLKIALELARNLTHAAFLVDHLERELDAEGVE